VERCAKKSTMEGRGNSEGREGDDGVERSSRESGFFLLPTCSARWAEWRERFPRGATRNQALWKCLADSRWERSHKSVAK
jgi:hypothetical protein